MQMTQYLLDTFEFNDATNRSLLSVIAQMPDKSEAVKLFSHLINCQYKWIARVLGNNEQTKMDWWEPMYPLESLEEEWRKSLAQWQEYLGSHTDEQIETEVKYIGYDGTYFAAKPKDIALQLNYHSIHHRAQIQTMIRAQGLTPNFVDYIGTKYRRVSE